MKATIRNDAPTSRVRSTDIPKLRTSFSGIRINSSEIPAGSPIGLLLALTYAVTVSIPAVFKSEYPGNVLIRTTD